MRKKRKHKKLSGSKLIYILNKMLHTNQDIALCSATITKIRRNQQNEMMVFMEGKMSEEKNRFSNANI